MRMKRTTTSYQLPGREIRSLEEFYDVISLKLSLPSHFGRNLDALWDVLTTDLEGPVEIIWEESTVSKRAMGPIYDRISALLKGVQKERDDFHVIFR